MFNTIPNNPFPPSSANAGGAGGGSYVLPVASADTLGGVKVGNDLNIGSDGTLNVLCTIPTLDKYNFSVNGENGFVIKKTHDGVETTSTYPSGDYTTYTIDNLFTLAYDGNWTITLLVSSTEYASGTSWSSGYMEQPSISELDFVIGSRTGTASEFLTELFYR